MHVTSHMQLLWKLLSREPRDAFGPATMREPGVFPGLTHSIAFCIFAWILLVFLYKLSLFLHIKSAACYSTPPPPPGKHCLV